jgi:hypothetical protein
VIELFLTFEQMEVTSLTRKENIMSPMLFVQFAPLSELNGGFAAIGCTCQGSWIGVKLHYHPQQNVASGLTRGFIPSAAWFHGAMLFGRNQPSAMFWVQVHPRIVEYG